MSFQAGHVKTLLIAASLVLALFAAHASAFYSLPPNPAPDEYGNVLIDRNASRNGMLPVYFSHWSHRVNYTCEVCHTELEFNMARNTTDMTETDHRAGRFCGACHDGVTAFGHEEECERCHNGDIGSGREAFAAKFNRKPYPTTTFGNGIDWGESLRRGIISPARFLEEEVFRMRFDRTLVLEAELGNIPPAIFPHAAHTDWMGCDTCHPEIFNIKKKTTEHFAMSAILQGKFCGVCHLKVAFPMNECAMCHPGAGD